MLILPNLTRNARASSSSIFTGTTTGNSNIATASMRAFCTITVPAGGSSLIRASFKAGSSGNLIMAHQSVGIGNGTFANTTAVPIELLVSGASGVNIAANATVTTDWAILHLPGGALTVILVEDYTSSSWGVQATLGGGRTYFTSGTTATYNLASPGNGNTTDGLIDAITSIEVM